MCGDVSSERSGRVPMNFNKSISNKVIIYYGWRRILFYKYNSVESKGVTVSNHVFLLLYCAHE